MDEAGESKRDQAARALNNFLGTYPYHHRDTPRFVVDLIIDAAKEEIRAEMAEQDEEDRWWQMRRIIGMCDGPQTDAFWEEYLALKAKREAAGKSTE
jgi:hypothetical protein